MIKNILSSITLITWLTMIIKSCLILIITPLILERYSDAQAHEWVFSITIFQFIMLCDAGFTATFTRFFAYSFGGDSSLKNKIFWVTSTIYSRIFILSISLGIIIYLYYKSLTTTSLLIIITIAISLYSGRYVAYFEGSGKIKLSRLILLYQSIFQASLTLFTCFLSLPIEFVLISYFSPIVSTLLVYLYFIHKDGIVSNPDYQFKERKLIISDGFKSAISLMTTIGAIQFVNIFTSQSEDIALQSNYLYFFMLLRQVFGFCQVVFYSKIPSLTILFSEGKLDEFSNSSKKYIITTIILGGISTIIIALLTQITFVYNLPAAESKYILILGLAFALERSFAMYQQYLSIKKIIYWHYTGPIFLFTMILISIITHPYIHIYSLPTAMIGASLFSLVSLYNLLRAHDEK